MEKQKYLVAILLSKCVYLSKSRGVFRGARGTLPPLPIRIAPPTIWRIFGKKEGKGLENRPSMLLIGGKGKQIPSLFLSSYFILFLIIISTLNLVNLIFVNCILTFKIFIFFFTNFYYNSYSNKLINTFYIFLCLK